MPLVEQELFTRPGHLSSHSVISEVRVTQSLVISRICLVLLYKSLVLCVIFLRSLFVFCILAILLSVLLYTDSGCHFGIFKVFNRKISTP